MVNDTSTPFTIREAKTFPDIYQVPDLIELCFHPWLDSDGLLFINEMRKAADLFKRLGVLSHLIPPPYTISGIVCETDDGKIVGNVSLFPAYVQENLNFLIANVCVHPDYRGHAIGQKMMIAAIEKAQKDGGHTVFLQVRMETPHVISMYRKLQFREDAHRISWIHPKTEQLDPPYHNTRISYVPRGSIHSFEKSFLKLYPENIRWKMNYSEEIATPGIIPFFTRKLSGDNEAFLQVSETDTQKIIGWFIFQRMKAFYDKIWVVPNQPAFSEETRRLLKITASRYCKNKAILLNLPSEFDPVPLAESGFFRHNDLLWMSRPV